jgi:hypothetical protein
VQVRPAPGYRSGLLALNHIFCVFYVAGRGLTGRLPAEIVASPAAAALTPNSSPAYSTA